MSKNPLKIIREMAGKMVGKTIGRTVGETIGNGVGETIGNSRGASLVENLENSRAASGRAIGKVRGKVFCLAVFLLVLGMALGAGRAEATAFGGAAKAISGTNWYGIQYIYDDDTYNGIYDATYSSTTQDNLYLTSATTNLLNIPAGSTINGVSVNVYGYNSSTTATNRQLRIALTKDGVNPTGIWKTITLTTTKSTIVSGSVTDLWGTTLTSADVRNPSFGVLIADNDTVVGGVLRIDSVSLSVDASAFPPIYGTAIANSTVHLVINGVDKGTTVADVAGGYSFFTPIVSGDAVLAFIEGDPTYKINQIAVATGTTLNMQIYLKETYNNQVVSLVYPASTNAKICQSVGNFTSPDVFVSCLGTDVTINGNKTFKPSTYNTGGNLTVNGNLAASGTFTNSGNLTVTGDFSVGNTFSGGSGAITINGNLTFENGFNSTSGILYLGGNLTNNGSFTHKNGTVMMNGVNQTINGSTTLTTFYNFSKVVNVTDTLTIQSGNTVEASNNFTLKGVIGQLLKLRSSTPGTYWKIKVPVTRTIDYVDVQDSYALDSLPANLPVNATNFTDNGNNVAWIASVFGYTDPSNTIRLILNGVDKGTTVANTNGIFSFYVPIVPGDAALVFVESHATYKMNAVGVASGESIHMGVYFKGVSYNNRVLIATDGVTNAKIAQALGAYASPEIFASVSGSTLTTTKELFVTKTFTPGGDLVLSGLNIASQGVLNAPSLITVSGTLTLSGTGFNHNNGTVVLNGTNQTITGDWSFYNFTKNVSSADTLTITSGDILSFSGAVNINGAPDQLLTLTSTGSWRFNLLAGSTRSLSYLSVKGSNASGSLSTLLPVNPLYSVSVSNNTNWWYRISGTVYKDNGVTNIGIGKTVRVVYNGTSIGTAVTNASGAYTFDAVEPLIIRDNGAYMVHLDGDPTYRANTYKNATGYDVTGIDLYDGMVIPSQVNNSVGTTAIGNGSYIPPTPGDLLYSGNGTSLNVPGTLYLRYGMTADGEITAGSMVVMSGGNMGTFNHTIGNLTLSSGVLTSTSGNLSISGNLTRTVGTFTHNSGTVTLTGTNQTISGGTIFFYNLTKEVATADTLAINGSVYIYGKVTLKGAPGQLLSLVSVTPGTQWSFNLTNGSTREMSYLAVKNSTAAGSYYKPIAPEFSIPMGNTISWFGGFMIDAQIKKAADATYTGTGIIEPVTTTQTVTQAALSNNSFSYNILFQNNAESADSFVVTGPAAASGFTVQYLDETETDRTAAVTDAGYTVGPLASGETRIWTVNVSMPATVLGGATFPVTIKATSVSDSTKKDNVKATTSSISARATLTMTTNKPTPKPGEDVVLTTTVANGAGLTAASGAAPSVPVPANMDYKVGSVTFVPGTSTLTAVQEFSNDNKATWAYTPASGGCGAPAGYDRCVTHVRWSTTGSMPAGTNCTLGMTVRLR